MFTRLTIVRQIYDKNLADYSKSHRLYVAREATSGYSQSGEVYLLTTDIYNPNYVLTLDLDKDTEPMRNNASGRLDNQRIYVEREKIVTPAGYFKVKNMVPAESPTEEFINRSIDRSKFTLYEVTHIPLDGRQTGSLSRVFSEVVPPYCRGEDIPGNETRLVRKTGPQDQYNYYIHDKALYDKRVIAALFPRLKKG